MAKTQYKCSNCGKVTAKWSGQCSSCKQWSTLEEVDSEVLGLASTSGKAKGFRASKAATNNEARPVSEIAKTVESTRRTKTGINEFDRVLGGGLVDGGVILLAGAPGCGKSTLSLHVASNMAQNGKKVLYITGEETAAQVASRAVRIGAASSNEKDGQELGENLFLLAEGNLQNALQQIVDIMPDLLVVDSVQTLLSEESEGSVGSITQVKEVATDITNAAKRLNIPTVIIGHVTKEGSIAGPRVVEHLVDVVLFFESSEDSPLRMLRGVKNRYGSTDEVGMFQHTVDGLEAVSDPSAFFVDTHAEGTTGFATSVTLEGRRALPIEIQALVTPTKLPNPRKISQGIEHGRSLMIQAVLDKYLGMRLMDRDVYVATTGGLRLQDPATDLATIAALISSDKDIAIPSDVIFLGEVSLTGEIRTPKDRNRRIVEASRLSFSTIYTTPGAKLESVTANVIEVRTLAELARYIAKYPKTQA